MTLRAVLCALVLGTTVRGAAAEPERRPLRWSVGAGSSFLLTGQHGSRRTRADAHAGVMPGGGWGRWGLTVAARHLTFQPFASDGMVTGGVLYQAAASRPRLALALHADVGATIGEVAPVIGGGLETHLWIWPKRLGPLALVFDLTAHLVIDGVEETRLAIASATRLSIAF